jgi:hypothetical protein
MYHSKSVIVLYQQRHDTRHPTFVTQINNFTFLPILKLRNDSHGNDIHESTYGMSLLSETNVCKVTQHIQ